jgi:AcrR family transcriptional regulator
MEPSISPRSTYHHGNLRAALIQATLCLIEEKGPDQVTVAEAAKRAGVSSGAPFRHFSSKVDLMTSVAEVLQAELLQRMEMAYGQDSEDPWETLWLLGLTYMNWGLELPTHFQTYSNRKLYNFESSPLLLEGDEKLSWLVESTFVAVLPESPVRRERARRLNIHSRALLTGLINLYCGGHFPRFGIEGEEAMVTMQKSWWGLLRSVRFNVEDRPKETSYYTIFMD